MKALVLDFGGPVLKTPFEVLRVGERRADLPPGTLAWSGPFAPQDDDLWRSQQSGAITERAYWQRRAEDYAALTGAQPSFQGLMDVLFAADEDELVRPQARALIHDAREAGYAVAVCTNDMRAFHGDAWVERMTVLRDIDVIVDGSVEQVLKPDPAIYQLVVERLGIDATECLFVDDQPINVAGARDVGMEALWFDVVDPDGSIAKVQSLLGLVR
jgi:putative hydrolase of the HAD superfamily